MPDLLGHFGARHMSWLVAGGIPGPVISSGGSRKTDAESQCCPAPGELIGREIVRDCFR
jgi:hypothetical protein